MILKDKCNDNKNKGFSLVELLIATSISAIIMLSLYIFLSQIVQTNSSINKHVESNIIKAKLAKLTNNDFTMGAAKRLVALDVDKGVEFESYNTLYFNKAMPVIIRYYIDEQQWLVREESLPSIEYVNSMRLVPDITDFTVQSFSYTSGKFVDGLISSRAQFLRFYIVSDNRTFSIVIGNLGLNK